MKSQLGLSGFYQNFCGRDGRVNSRMVVWMGSRCYVWMCGCHYDVFRSVGCSLKNVDWFNYCCYQRQQNRIYLLGDVCHLLACKFGLCRLFVCLFVCLFVSLFLLSGQNCLRLGFFFFFFFFFFFLIGHQTSEILVREESANIFNSYYCQLCIAGWMSQQFGTAQAYALDKDGKSYTLSPKLCERFTTDLRCVPVYYIISCCI